MVPLAQRLSLIVAIPETAIEDGSQSLVPRVLLLLGESTVKHRLDGLLIAVDNGIHIFRSARATFYFKYAHTRPHHAVNETDGLQVLGRHDVFVVYLQFCSRLAIRHNIAPTANLHTGATIGRPTGVVQTHIALTADGHTECSVTEHFYTHQLTLRTTNVLLLYLPVDIGHLIEIQLTRQHHHISKLGIELQCLDVRDVQLRRQVHLYAYLATILHHRHIRCDDGCDVGLLGGIHNLVHQLDVLTIDDGVHRQIRLHILRLTLGCDVSQIVYGEMVGRVRTHIQLLNAEIDASCPCLEGCSQRLSTTHRSHNFVIF